MSQLSLQNVEFCYECHYAECNCAECNCAECNYAECHNAECHYTECHYTERHYTECRGVHSMGEELAFSEIYWMKSMKTSERQTETTLGKSELCTKL